jgi:gentisate 1,2-dioxygenase
MQNLESESADRLTKHLVDSSLWAHWLQRPKGARVEPAVWRWSEIYSCLLEAGESVRLGGVVNSDNAGASGDRNMAERRVVELVNPSLANLKLTSKTLQMCFQLVKPGEVAWTHRHTAAAFRFVVQGKGAYTTVQGERFVMEPGDLILTPNWTWHGHTNGTTEPIVWIDGLDAPIVRGTFDAMFLEEYESESQQITKRDDYSRSMLGVVRPKINWDRTRAPCMNYKWTDTLSALENLSTEPDPVDGTLLEYVNPLTGGPTMPTISCRIQMLPSNASLNSHRHTGMTAYHVMKGKGFLEVDDKRIDWGPRDCFVVPSWRWHRFVTTGSETPILFSMTDKPIMDTLGLYREESK